MCIAGCVVSLSAYAWLKREQHTTWVRVKTTCQTMPFDEYQGTLNGPSFNIVRLKGITEKRLLHVHTLYLVQEQEEKI